MAKLAAPSVPLKPCPFCGAAPITAKRDLSVTIRCDGFRNGCFIAPAASGTSIEQAAGIWNRRHQDGQGDE